MHLRHRTTAGIVALATLGLLVPVTAAAGVVQPSPPPVARLAVPTAQADVTSSVDVTVDTLAVVVPAQSMDTPAPTPTPEVAPQDGGPLVAALDVAGHPSRTATPAVVVDGVQTVGVTWPEGADAEGLDVQVRTRSHDNWSSWVPLDVGEGPDGGTPDATHATRGGTDSLWVGDADAVQLSFDAADAAGTAGLRLALVGSSVPPSEPSDGVLRTTSATLGASSRSVARASVATDLAIPTVGAQQPRVISRAEWGAPAQVCTPDVASGLVGAAVHHTAGSNAYTTVAEAEQQIRNDAAYHIQGRGWCDIGYNFIVDKWGNIYEGRAGSLTQPVIGVHAGGFNTGTVGIAMLGTYDDPPPLATQIAVGRIIGWRLGAYRVDPRGTMTYSTGVGENSRYMNETVTLPRVFGHRDVAFTACPGNGGYAALPAIRNTAWDASVEAWANPPTSLLRTSADATVFLVSGSSRYPITDLATMGSLAPLGPVAFVAKQYLDAWTVGAPVRRLIMSPDGTVSFFDAGIRLWFGTCAQVADFGMTCADATRLDAVQTALLHDGGRMVNLYRTTTGKAFYVTAGTKREVADDASLIAAGLPANAVRLLETGIGYLPYGDPIVRPSMVLHERAGTNTYLLDGSATSAVVVPDVMRAVPGVPSTGGAMDLDRASLARITVSGSLAPIVTAGAGGPTYFVSERGKSVLTDPAAAPSPTPPGPAAILAAIPTAAPITGPFFLKADKNGTVYVVRAGATRPLRAWGDLVSLNGGNPTPSIVTASDGVVRQLAAGAPYNPPGMMAKTATSGTVYLLDGDGSKITISTFAVTAELGAVRLAVVPDAELQQRTSTAGYLLTIVQCGTQTFIGLNGAIWPVRPADRAAFPPSATTLDPTTCAALPHSSRPAERFLRTSDGTIYWLDAAVKRPIGSYARFLDLGGSASTMIQVSDFAASQLPTGPRI